VRRGLARIALAAAVALAMAAGHAVENDPLPVPEQGPRQKAIESYNEGVQLLLAKRYGEAQRRFEQAIAGHEAIAEAHNNLAFSLRMQGAHNFELALRHYARALEINPRLAQAYMYRGVLYAQVGDMQRARADLETLRGLDRHLAARLEAAIAQDTARQEREGISSQLDVY
jgi:tetratricopeptide (TPR) repeat protein